LLPRLTLLLIFPFLAFCADYQIEANIRYGAYPETVLDIVQPLAPALKNRPGVIVIHGDEGDKDSTLAEFCRPLVQHDFVAANVEYRPAKAAPAPAALNDVLEAAQWFRNHAARYKVDPNLILVLGEAAGGRLALLVGMTPASTESGASIKVSAVIDFYGASDDAIQYVRRGLPPILAIHGDADTVVPYEQSVRLTKDLKAAGDDTELITIPGGQHGFQPDQMARLWPQIFKWLKKRKIGS
jgi:acetyl esterase/lipase